MTITDASSIIWVIVGILMIICYLFIIKVKYFESKKAKHECIFWKEAMLKICKGNIEITVIRKSEASK